MGYLAPRNPEYLRSRQRSLHHLPPDRLTGGLDVDHGPLGTLSGHGVPRAIRVLDPLRGLTVELALVRGLQVEDGEAEGGAPQLVQVHLPQAQPLRVVAARLQHKVPAQGDDLHRLLAAPLPEPGHREVAVLQRLRGYVTCELQGVLLHFVQSLGHSAGLQGVRDHCNTGTAPSTDLTLEGPSANPPGLPQFRGATEDPGQHRNRMRLLSGFGLQLFGLCFLSGISITFG